MVEWQSGTIKGPGAAYSPARRIARVLMPISVLLVLGGLGIGLGCSGGDSGGHDIGSFERFARAERITDRNQLIGGPAAIANIGDFIIENDKVRLAVLGAFESFGPGLFGGSLVDAELQRADGSATAGRGQDELTEIFPLLDLRVQLPGAPDGTIQAVIPISSSVNVLDRGGRDRAAVVRMEAGFTPIVGLAGILAAASPLNPASLHLIQDYVLEPGAQYVKIVSEVQFRAPNSTEFTPLRRFRLVPSEEPIKALNPILFGQAYGDIAIFGGKATLFSPDFGFDFFPSLLKRDPTPSEDRVFDELQPFRNTLDAPLTGAYLVGVGERMSYGMTAPSGITSIPLTAATITPQFYGTGQNLVNVETGEGPGLLGPKVGDSVTYERFFIVGEGDVASVLDHVYTVRNVETGLVRGQAFEEATGRPLIRHRVLVFPHPRDGAGNLIDLATLDLRAYQIDNAPVSSFLTDVRLDDLEDDGSFRGRLPPGDYFLVGLTAGRGRSRLIPLSVSVGETTRVRVPMPQVGKVRIEVRDAGDAGRPIPSKLTVVELDGKGVPWSRFGEGSLPISRIPRIGGIYEPQFFPAERTDLEFVADLAFTADGRHTFELDPGRYRIYASRGYEYTVDVKEVTVRPGLDSVLQMAVARVIDTTGWLSADYHIHSEGSHDSGCTKDERVVGYAAEGVEFMAATDHDYLTNYQPYIARNGLQEYVTSSVGDELTTFEVGHYNAFPLRFDSSANSNGAPGWFNLSPPQIFETLESLGKYGPEDTITILNHPRDSIFGLYSQFGFDQGTGELCPGLFTLGNPIIRGSLGGAAIGPVQEQNFCIDCFVAMEVLNGKRYELIRTPTIEEIPLAEEGQTRPLDPVPYSRILTRTMEEQRRINDPDDPLMLTDQSRYQGGLDDFFTTLNFGSRVTGLANSDSHKCKDTASTRSWMQVGLDNPSALEERDVIDAIMDGKVTMGYGTFVTAFVDGQGIGSTVTDRDGIVDLRVKVQAAPWFEMDRVEVYGNGELVAERTIQRPGRSTVRFDEVIPVDLTSLAINDFDLRDTYLVVVALGDDDLFPVNFPEHLPAQNTSDIIVGALAGLIPGLGAVENIAPLTFNNAPLGITNPIFVDVDGDGVYTAPGRPPTDGQFKGAQCDGASTQEECACEDIEPASEEAQQALAVNGFARWILALDQIHGRLRATPPEDFEFGYVDPENIR